MRITKEAEKALQSVCNQIANKYFLPGYAREDIFQEAYLIALVIYEKYEKAKGPVENFLRASTHNAFQNFIRSKSVSQKPCGCIEGQSCKKCLYRDSKAKVLYMKSLPEDTNLVEESVNYYRERLKEMLPIINVRLPLSMRTDWRKILDEAHVVKSRKLEIQETVRQIIEDYEQELEEKRYAPISYEYGWENGYFFIETDEHLAKIYMDEEWALVLLHSLSANSRQIYMKLREGGAISYEEVVTLAEDFSEKIGWDV